MENIFFKILDNSQLNGPTIALIHKLKVVKPALERAILGLLQHDRIRDPDAEIRRRPKIADIAFKISTLSLMTVNRH